MRLYRTGGRQGWPQCQGAGNGAFMSYTQSIHEKVNIEIINIERWDGDEGRSLESTFYLSLSGIMELSKQANFEVTQL